MKRVKILALLLGFLILGLSSCAQRPCPAYSKADLEYKKEKKQGQF